MKAFIAFSLILFLSVGVAVGIYGWGRWNRIEQRGTGLSVGRDIPDNKRAGLVEQYNQILDREDILLLAVQEHGLMDYYKVGSEEEAVARFREDSFVELPGGRALHVLFKGKRSTRKLREKASQTIAAELVKVLHFEETGRLSP